MKFTDDDAWASHAQLEDDAAIDGVNDGDFHDPWWLPGSHRAKNALAEATRLTALAADAHRKRGRKASDQRRFERQVAAYVCDLWRRDIAGLSDAIVVSRAKRTLDAAKGRYDHPDLTGSAADVQDALHQSGLCEMLKGEWGGSQEKGRSTTLRATDRLRELLPHAEMSDFIRDPEEEVILLRGAKKDVRDGGGPSGKPGNLIEYEDDAETRRMRRALRTINQHLQTADIVLDDGVLESITDERFDPSSRRLYRIFANGRFDNGGRLYRGFWIGLPSASRHDVLQIDGEAITILDYGQMSARLAYGKVGVVPPTGDLYAAGRLATWQRDGVKKLINAALFSSAPLTRRPKGTRKLLPKGRISELMAVLRQAHPPIAPLFETGEGLRIQRTESDIMVEVLLRLIDVRITALPIHDAVIVAQPHKQQAEEVMRDVFREMSGVEAIVSASA